MDNEIKEFNRLKRNAEKIVKNERYDCIEITENEVNILSQIGQAETYKDLSPSIYYVADYFFNELRQKMKKVKLLK